MSGARNPLAIDPEFWRVACLYAPFNHGLCTFGCVGRAVLAGVFGGDVDAFGTLEGRFADQVWPEDTIVTKVWRDGDGAVVEASTQKGNVVLSQARAIARRARSTPGPRSSPGSGRPPTAATSWSTRTRSPHRKSGAEGQSGSVRLDHGGLRTIKKKT